MRRQINWPLVIGGTISGIFVILALFGPRLAPHNPLAQSPDFILTGFRPGELPGYPLGTDEAGRDVLSRILWGIRPTLLVCLAVMVARVTVGTILGLIAGWYRGIPERIVDLLSSLSLALPALIVAIASIVLLGVEKGMWVFIVGLTLTGWAETTVMVRGVTQTVRTAPFVESARAIGARPLGVIRRHLLPQLWPLLPSLIAFELSAALLLVAELGFLGIFIGGGFVYYVPSATPIDFAILTAGLPELGQMLSGFWAKVFRVPWDPLFVGLVIFIQIIGFNLLGEGLRRRLDITRPRRVWLQKQIERRYGVAHAAALMGPIRLGTRTAAAGLVLLLIFVLARGAPPEQPGRAQASSNTPSSGLGAATGGASSPQLTQPTAQPGQPGQPTGLAALTESQLWYAPASDRRNLRPLNQQTLEPSGPLEGAAPMWVESSRDGKTIAALIFESDPVEPDHITPLFIFVDGDTGEVRSTMEAHIAVMYDPLLMLSADGSTLLTYAHEGFSGGSLVTYKVADGKEGALVNIAEETIEQVWLAPDGSRIYVLQMRGGSERPFVPSLLRAFDAATGQEIASLELTDMGGNGTISRDALRLTVTLVPGVALSPDGATFAIVHADASKLTFVNAADLTITSTVETGRTAPTAINFARLWLTYSADGSALFLSGEQLIVDDAGQRVSAGLGVQQLSAEDGSLQASAADGVRTAEMKVPSDISALYLLGPGTVEGQAFRYVLHHIDPNGLKEVAVQPFELQIFFYPVGVASP